MKTFQIILALILGFPVFADTPPPVINKVCPTSQWIDAIVPGAQPTCTQPAQSDISGILSIASGGTGQTSSNGALNALLPNQSSQSGKFLTTNGTNTSWATVSPGSSAFADLTSGTNTTAAMVVGTGASLSPTGSGTVTANAITDGTIVNADINAGAAIDASKIADGSVSSTEFQFINTLTSNAQTQLNGKQSTLTPGSISTSTTGVTVGSGANSTVGPNVTVDVQTASGSQPGLLSSTDWTTFNSKQPAGSYITALTGDVTATGPGSSASTIANGAISLSGPKVTGTLPIANGGTGQTTANTAFNALVPSQTGNSGKVLSTDGTNTAWSAAGAGSVTSVGITGGDFGISNSPITTAGDIALSLAWPLLTPTDTANFAIRSDSDTGEKYPSDGLHDFYNNNVKIMELQPGQIKTNVVINATGDITLPVKTANTFYAGPTTGSPATPVFRTIASGDIPAGAIPYPLQMPGGFLDIRSDSDTGFNFPSDGVIQHYANNVKTLEMTANLSAFTGDVTATGSISADGNLTATTGNVTATAGNIVGVDGVFSGNISAANYPPPPPTGTANTLPNFDGSGSLGSLTGAQTTSDGTLLLNPTLPASTTLYPLQIQIPPGSAPDSINALVVNNQADTFNSSTLIDLNDTGANGDSFNGLRLFKTGSTVNGLNMATINNSATFGSNMRMLDMNNSGAGAGGIELSVYNNAAMTGPFTTAQIADDGAHTDNGLMLNLNKNSGDITGSYGMIARNLNANVTGDVNMDTTSFNGAHTVGGNLTFGNWYTDAAVTGNTNFMFFSDSGSSAARTGLNMNFSGAVTGNETALGINSSGSANTKTGINVNLTGSTTGQVQGVNIDVSNVTSPNYKTGLSVSGGGTFLNSILDTSIITPSGVGQLNVMGGQFTVASGFPITGGAALFGNNLGVTAVFQDDMPTDFIGGLIGFSVNGLVNQTAVAAGKTVANYNFMTAGGGTTASGGTITDANVYNAVGFVGAPGDILVTTLTGFHARSPLCAMVTGDCYSFQGDAGKLLNSEEIRTNTSFVMRDPGGTDTITLQAPTLAAPYTLTLPVDDGASGEVLSTDGSGVLSWVSAGGMSTDMSNTNATTAIPSGTNLQFASSGSTSILSTSNVTGANNSDALTIQTGSITDAGQSAGTISIQPGDGGAGNGANLTLRSSAGDTLTGNVRLLAANAHSGANIDGGSILQTAGNGDGAANGGQNTVTAGDGGTTGNGGANVFFSGTGVVGGDNSFISANGSAQGGAVTFTSGSCTDPSCNPGSINYTVGSDGVGADGQVNFSTQGVSGVAVTLNLFDGATAQILSFKAPDTMSGSYTLTLPPDAGVDGDSLVTNGSGVTTFTNKHANGVQLSTSGSQPTCDAAHRGLMWNIEGTTDVFQICQNVASVYTWVTH